MTRQQLIRLIGLAAITALAAVAISGPPAIGGAWNGGATVAKKKQGARGPRGKRGARGPAGAPGTPGVQGPVGPVHMSPPQDYESDVATVPAGEAARVIAQCPHNFGVIAGGYRTNWTVPPEPLKDAKMIVTENRAAAFGWMAVAVNTGTEPGKVQAIARCVPIGDAARG